MINRQKLIRISATIAIVAAGLFAAYYFLTFHVTGTTPSLRKVAAITPIIKVNFNKPIKSVGEVTIKGGDNILHSYTFDGKQLRILLNKMEVNKTITITLTDVVSTDDYTIGTKVLTFTTKDIAADKLPKDQFDELIIQQDRDTNANADPISAVLPHSTLHYTATLEVAGVRDDGSNRMGAYVEINLSASDVRIDREQAIDDYKTEFVDYLVSKGIDSTNYQIVYKIIEPSLY